MPKADVEYAPTSVNVSHRLSSGDSSRFTLYVQGELEGFAQRLIAAHHAIINDESLPGLCIGSAGADATYDTSFMVSKVLSGTKRASTEGAIVGIQVRVPQVILPPAIVSSSPSPRSKGSSSPRQQNVESQEERRLPDSIPSDAHIPIPVSSSVSLEVTDLSNGLLSTKVGLPGMPSAMSDFDAPQPDSPKSPKLRPGQGTLSAGTALLLSHSSSATRMAAASTSRSGSVLPSVTQGLVKDASMGCGLMSSIARLGQHEEDDEEFGGMGTCSRMCKSPDHFAEVADAWADVLHMTTLSGMTKGRTHTDTQIGDDHTTGEPETELETSPFDSASIIVRLLAHIMISPRSVPRLAWDFFGFATICFDAIWTPMLLLNPAESDVVETIIWVLRVYWTMDIPATFMTGYYHQDGHLITNPRIVAWHYMTTWFGFDLGLVLMDWLEVLVSLAFSYMQFARVGRMMRTLRILRCLRMSRVLKVNSVIDKMFEGMQSGERSAMLLAIFKSILCLVTFTHVMACIWHRIGEDSPTEYNWLEVHDYLSRDISTRYFCSLHWATTQFLGEGTVSAHNFGEHMYSVVTLLMAFVVSAVFVSSFTTHMTRIQMLDFEEQRQFAMLRRYLRSRDISQRLRMRVTRSTQSAVDQRKHDICEADVALLALLSEPIRMDLHFEVHSHSVHDHPLFHFYCHESTAAMKQVCHKAMAENMVVSRGDVVFSAGEPAQPRMLIVKRGHLTYYKEGEVPVILAEGEWVCEMVLWLDDWTHKGLLRAEEECELVVLDAGRFQRIAMRAWNLADIAHPCFYAEWFCQNLNEVQTEEWSDCSMDFDFDQWLRSLERRHSERSGNGDTEFKSYSFTPKSMVETLRGSLVEIGQSVMHGAPSQGVRSMRGSLVEIGQSVMHGASSPRGPSMRGSELAHVQMVQSGGGVK